MFTETSIILAVMVGVYAGGRALRLSTELAMLAAAIGGAWAGGYWFPARHVAEGAATYLDINLIFFTATLFMNLLKASGGVAFAVRAILRGFHRQRALLLTLLSLVLLIPGALTGAGSVTVLIVGGMVATVLGHMGIPKVRVAAIVFLIAGLSAAAPPVSLWAMMTAAGVNMPYVGFFWPLLIPCLLGALVTSFALGWKGTPTELDQALRELPEAPAGMSWWRISAPFLLFFGLVALGRTWPHSTPVIGLPLMFAAAAVLTWLLAPQRIGWASLRDITGDTVRQLLPLLATLTIVGVLVQVMTLTGVRGLLAVTAATLPVMVVYATLFLVLPVSEAVLMWGAAPVIGVPLVLLFNTIGLNPIVALAGMSVIWPLGDALPPTAIIGRLTVDRVGYDGPYGVFLKACLWPSVFIIVIGTLMVVFSGRLGWLTGL